MKLPDILCGHHKTDHFYYVCWRTRPHTGPHILIADSGETLWHFLMDGENPVPPTTELVTSLGMELSEAGEAYLEVVDV